MLSVMLQHLDGLNDKSEILFSVLIYCTCSWNMSDACLIQL